MWKRLLLKFICLLIAISAVSTRLSVAEADAIPQCKLTPEIWSYKQPDFEFAKSNDLTKTYAGSSERANGQMIILKGRVLDSSCVPIGDATVEIWQPNWLGIYQNESKDYAKFDKNFLGSGSMITSNLGHFFFTTIMPKSANGRAPHIITHIRHRDFADFETQLFFAEQFANNSDPMLKKYTNTVNRENVIAQLDYEYLASNDPQGIPTYQIDIVLDKKNKYKRL